jgi:hypothetical protein
VVDTNETPRRSKTSTSFANVELKKGGGGAERCLFGSSRFEPCDFSPQGRDTLIDFLHGKVVETLSDLVRRCSLSWRRAENLIVVSS